MRMKWMIRLVLFVLLSLGFCYGIITMGSPENSSRQLDGPNGVDSFCEPPGSLCHYPV